MAAALPSAYLSLCSPSQARSGCRWCGWDGEALRADWNNCTRAELFDHRNDSALYDVDGVENANVVSSPEFSEVVKELAARLRKGFTP